MFSARAYWKSAAVLLASAALCAVSSGMAPATTVRHSAVRHATRGNAVPAVMTAQDGLRQPAARPYSLASPRVYALFTGDSCVASPWTSYPYECEAVGFWLNGNYYSGLTEFSNSTGWYQPANVPTPPKRNEVLEPLEVSCAAVQYELPDCLFVGQHLNYGQQAEQVAEWGGANGFQVVDWRNPSGTAWSVMDDVSCPSASFCAVVGTAGKTSKSFHSTWFTWNGSKMREQSIPEPRSRQSDLGGVSCASVTNCVATGYYQTSSGRIRAYAEIWANGKWKLENMPDVKGEKATWVNAISCPSATECLAVGFDSGPGTHPFAEIWNGSKWRLTRLPSMSNAALDGVSCPTLNSCMAAGYRGQAALAEQWSGSAWRTVPTKRTTRSASADGFTHVSCLSPTSCVAVGYRYDAKVKYSDKTLVELWNGHSWKVQASLNN